MDKEIHLYTEPTMKGWKPVLLLEEAQIPYEPTHIDKEQKQAWYLKINPNGRIPSIVESGAILWYLAEKYSRSLPTDPKLRSETHQRLMFQMAGVGP